MRVPGKGFFMNLVGTQANGLPHTILLEYKSTWYL